MTNIVEFEAPAAIERQAREWLIRLDGDAPLSAAEEDSLREWLDRSPLHRDELTRLSKFWNQANILTELAVPLGRSVGKRAWRRPRFIAVAASLFLVVSIAVTTWWLQDSLTDANGTYATAIGQQQTISLPDGSSIELNTDSEVQVGFEDQFRRIHLLRGEALFFVARDPSRPFEVYAASGMVRAVGTAFSVHLEGLTVNVTVTKGVVDVADIGTVQPMPSGESLKSEQPHRKLGRLKAGQTTTFGSGVRHIDVLQLAEPELQRRIAWHEGYLVFSGEPLGEVIEQVNRYSPVTLEIADPSLASIAVGGRFRVGDLDAVLDVLHENFGIRSSHVDERSITLTKQ